MTKMVACVCAALWLVKDWVKVKTTSALEERDGHVFSDANMDNKLVDENHNKIPQSLLTLDESTINAVDGDDVWRFLGRLGWYQRWQTLLIFLLSTTIAMPVLNGLFVGKDVDFKCFDGDDSDRNTLLNVSVELSQCSKKVVDTDTSRVLSETECTDFRFEGNGTALSYISEWRLVCGDEVLGNLPQTMTMVGMGIGASTLPQIGDRLGRKKLIVGSLVCLSAVNLAMAFVPQFELFVLLKFLSGAFNQGFMVPISVVMVELLPTELRSLASLLNMSFWVMSSFLTGIIGSMLREADWRTMQIVFGSMSAGIIIFLCFMDESLRWLLGNNKISDARALMKKACRMNNKDYQDLMNHALKSREAKNGIGNPGTHHRLLSPLDKPGIEDNEVADDEGSKLLMILKNGTMRRISFIMCYTWMVCALTYYGLILLSTSLAGDPYVNYFIGAAAEWPAGLLMAVCIHRFGRKKSILVFQFISGVSLICAVLVANFAPADNVYSVVQTCFTITGKFFVSGSFNAIWIYTPELYPTNLRNIGIGISSASARLGATFSPFFKMLARKAMWAPGALFAVCCFINVFLLTFVPETRWRELPNDVAEIEAWVKDDNKNKIDKHVHLKDDVDI